MQFPWSGRFLSPILLQQWLNNAGYSRLKDKTLCFRLPGSKGALTRSTFFFEALGQIAAPMLGVVSVFLVEKRVHGMLLDTSYLQQPKAAIRAHSMIRPSTGNSR